MKCGAFDVELYRKSRQQIIQEIFILGEYLSADI